MVEMVLCLVYSSQKHDSFSCLTWLDLSDDHFVGERLGLR